MSNPEKLYTPIQGKTYTLFAEGDDSEHYYAEIKRLADVFRASLLRLTLLVSVPIDSRPDILGPYMHRSCHSFGKRFE